MKSFAKGIRAYFCFSKQTISRLIWVMALLALALSFGGRRAIAQSTSEGAIGGTVFDPSGAVVPGATVTVHNNGTNAEHGTKTDASGYYRIGGLPPAVYTVTVTAAGFETSKSEQVIVQVGAVT